VELKQDKEHCMFTLFRKLIKLVRGGASPWQIILSCMLGTMLGMSPSFNALVLAGIVLFLILNLSLGLMLIGVLAGKALCLIAAPVTFEIGYVIIHSVGLESLFATAYQTPFIALMDLDRYCLVGGIPVGLIVGGVLGYFIARTIQLLRIGSLLAGEKSKKFQRVSGNIFTRVILRILFGKQKKTLAEMLGFKHPILRKSGIVFCLVIVGLVIGFEMLFINQLAQSGLVSGLEASMGSEVNVKGVNLSLTGGNFSLEGLQITDPDKPTHNMINIQKLSADINIRDLLTKRVVIDEIVIGEMLSGDKREKAGQVYRQPERPDEPESESTITDYFEYKDQILDYLAKLKDYLENQDEQRKVPEEEAPENTRERALEIAKTNGYLKASATNLLVQRPTVTIRHIKVEKLPIPNVGICTLDINELSNSLALNEKPMSFLVENDKKGDEKFETSGMLDFINPGAMHALKVKAPNLSVGAMGLTDKCPLDISEAMVNVAFDGQFNRKKLAFPLTLQVHGMKSTARDGRSVLGIDSALAAEVFKNFEELKIAADISGAVANPKVKVDMGKTLPGLEKALKAAGFNAAANMAGEQLKKILPGGIPIKIPGVPTSNPADILKGAGDILKGKAPIGNPLELLKKGGVSDFVPKKDDDKPSKGNPLDVLKGVTDLIPKKDDDKPTTKPKDPVGGLLDGLRL
jgi:uncharacterized protein (TIGR03546 family)